MYVFLFLQLMTLLGVTIFATGIFFNWWRYSAFVNWGMLALNLLFGALFIISIAK